MTEALSKLAEKFKMGNADQEEQQYLQEVEAVKQWWTDSRWRYTKRPFTAEQIVQKRGTLKIQYPSNDLASKYPRLCKHDLGTVLIESQRKALVTYGTAVCGTLCLLSLPCFVLIWIGSHCKRNVWVP